MLADEGHSVDGVFQHPRLFTSMDWQSSLEGPPCRDKVLAVKKKILGTFLIFVAGAAIGQVMSHPLPGGINGVVRLPDGAPLEGATVTAKTDCKEMGVNFVQEVKTLADGSFYVPPFATGDCNRIRLFAKKAEELWLETGHDVFYGGGNGTAPVVVIPSSTTTEITMGSQGASVSFRVRDKATDRFIWAELYIKRMPVPGKKFGSVQDYFAMNPPRERFAVQARQVTAKDISVDVRLIKPAKSYANPQARPCKP